MAKLNNKMLQRCYEWVCQYGLHPEPHGATIKSFCAAMGIDKKTYFRWSDNATFSTTIKEANTIFCSTLETSLVGSLVAQAKGDKQTKKRTIAKPDKHGKLKVKEVIMDEIELPKSTTAAIFLLKNIAPERWKDKHEHDVNMPPIVIEASDKGIKAMAKLNELAD